MQPVNRTHGFTLLELSITLAILAVLAAGVMVPFVAQVAQRNIANTERLLDQAKEALLGYAATTGRLPCPAIAASNGQESVANAATGACTTNYGFLPAVTIGFSPVDAAGFAIDAWSTQSNRIRYAVSDHGGANTFTRSGGMRSVGPAALAANPLLFVCGSSTASNQPNLHCGPGALGTGGSILLTDRAPVVIWSVGANALTGGGSADEAQNPNPNGGSADRIFVSKSMSNRAATEFDDLVTWLSVGNLVNRMVLAGQLP